MSRQLRAEIRKVQYLWRLDDPEWMRERKQQWRQLQLNGFSECGRDELKKYADYFVYGKYRSYIPSPTHHFLTPQSTPEESLLVFNYLISGFREKQRLLGLGHVSGVCSKGRTLPWLRQYVVNFIEGVLGSTYREIEIEDLACKKVEGKPPFKLASEDPTSCAKYYLIRSAQYLEAEEVRLEYDGVIDGYDYFISALKLATEVEERASILRGERFEILYEIVDEILEEGDDRPLAMEFAQKLNNNKEVIMDIWNQYSHLDKDGE